MPNRKITPWFAMLSMLIASSCTCDFTRIGQTCTRTYDGTQKNIGGDCGGALVCTIDNACSGECKGHCKKPCNGVDGCPFACKCEFTLADQNGSGFACSGEGC